ncbi:Fibroblast growth factor 20, partial [Frankliniella fusca]
DIAAMEKRIAIKAIPTVVICERSLDRLGSAGHALQLCYAHTPRSGQDQRLSAVLQRTSVNKVQVKMQGIATCLFLCMDACGLLYGSRELTDDCVFNEMLEQHYYNTYSSAKYSGAGPRGRSLYLALDRRGAPRRVQLRRDAPQGRLAAYTRVLTKPVAAERVADLLSRLRAPGAGAGAGAVAGAGAPASGAPHFRHRGHHAACPPHGHPEPTPRRPRRCPRPGQAAATRKHGVSVVARKRTAATTTTTAAPRSPSPPGSTGTSPPAPASAPTPVSLASSGAASRSLAGLRQVRRKCEATEDEDLCHKRLQMIAAKKRKSRNEKKAHLPHLKRLKVVRKMPAAVPQTTPAPASPNSTTTSAAPAPAPSPALHVAEPAEVLVMHPALQRAQPTTTTTSLPPTLGLVHEGDTSEEDDGEEEGEEHEESVTMTTEALTTSASLEEPVTAVGAASVDDP